MNNADLKISFDPLEAGREMYALIEELYPICRSITGDGFRQTMKILQRYFPLQIHEVPSGAEVFDWTIPKEWNIRGAYVKNSRGEKVIDFEKSNLHVLNYSTPVKRKISLSELKEHLFSLPEHPDWIPYKTSYYKEKWGFCIAHNKLMELKDEEYEVFIDSTLEGGHLTYGEYYLKGSEQDEVLISSHACHPSLANDNLSGVSVAAFLAKDLSSVAHRYSYRFLFVPGTIGAITWLCLNETLVKRIKHGLVIAGVGDSGKMTYKKSRRNDAEIDQVVFHVLKHSGEPYEITDFSPYGYDERQYCSPGFNLPVGRLSRTPYEKYPEYHTSADNLSFIKIESLVDSFVNVWTILKVLEENRKYQNTNPKCEPQLGKRKLYERIEGQRTQAVDPLALLWVLNMSDGDHSLLDIATLAQLPFGKLQAAARLLIEENLLREI